MKKSLSSHNTLNSVLDFSRGNFGVLRQFSRDYSILSKIYRRFSHIYLKKPWKFDFSREKTRFQSDFWGFFHWIAYSKEAEIFEFQKRTNKSSGFPLFREKPALWEYFSYRFLRENRLLARRSASQQLRETIQRSKLEISSDFKRKAPFSHTFHKTVKSPLFSIHDIRARTSNSLTRKTNRNEVLVENSNKYDVLFENSQENVWDILKSSNSSLETWSKKPTLTSILIQPII